MIASQAIAGGGPDMARIRAVETIDDGAALALLWSDGRRARFHAIWLRDNALDQETRAAGSGQRLITILDVPEDTRIEWARLTAGDELALGFAPDGKATGFPGAWLRARIYDHGEGAARDEVARREPGWTAPEVATWGWELAGHLPCVTFEDAKADRDALAAWLAGVRAYGVALMTGLPRESGAVCAVAQLFGYVRETNYGRWFDVRAEVDPVNLAYSSLGLQAHTDNPYRDPVPTLQLLACLESSAEGGNSLVVDGFRACAQLRRESPEAFGLLAGHCARFEYAGAAGVRLTARRPMIELAPDGELIAVRFNNRSAAPLLDVPYEAMAGYYRAYRRFAEIIERPELAVSFKLAPGELFLVDNTRVLHSRTAFTGTGRRWLQGCYADKDGLLSTLAVLEDARAQAAQ